jgi:hypothetical protein
MEPSIVFSVEIEKLPSVARDIATTRVADL